MAHAGGRPTKYDPSFVQRVYDYLDTVGREATKLPKRVDIALMLDVDDDTITAWGNNHPEFLGALTRVDALQMGQLMDDGMYGGKEVNARFAQFLLSANHNMAESTKSDITSAGEKLEAPHITLDIKP